MREYHSKLQQTLRAAGCKDPDAIHSWELLQVSSPRWRTAQIPSWR